MGMPQAQNSPDSCPSTTTPEAQEPPTSGALKSLGLVGALVVLSAALPPTGAVVLLTQIHDVAPWLRSLEILGVIIFILGFTMLSGFALLPSLAQALLAGWAFGIMIGLPATIIGFMGASLVGYAVARRCAGDKVVRLLQQKPALRAAHEALIGCGGWRAIWVVALLRLPPQSPFAPMNMILTSTGVGLTPYLIGTAIGMIPRTGLVVYIGSTLPELDFTARGHGWTALAGIFLALAVVLGLGLVAQRAIARTLKPKTDHARPSTTATETISSPSVLNENTNQRIR